MEYLINEQYDCEECKNWDSEESEFPCIDCVVFEIDSDGNLGKPTHFERKEKQGEWEASTIPYNPIINFNWCSDNIVDNVNSPSHYTTYPKEVKDIIEWVLEGSNLTPFEGWCVGNELKYRLRAGLKDPDKLIEDMEKALKVKSWRE
jgi:hypothetical protein